MRTDDWGIPVYTAYGQDRGMRIAYDPVRQFVNLMVGNFCVDQMSLHEYEHTFGLRAAVEVTRR